MLLVLAGCTSHPNGGGDDVFTFTPPSAGPEWEGPDTTVAYDDMEVMLTLDPEWTAISAGPTFADFDGDGLIDLLAADSQGAPDAESIQVLVRGPLDDVHVPDDAWVTTDNFTTHLEAAELTGDGQTNLLVTLDPDGRGSEAPRTLWGVPNPFDGSIEPNAAWTDLTWTGSIDTYIPDANGDGTLDRVWQFYNESEGESVHITYGPIERWDGPADVTLVPLCRDGGVYNPPEYLVGVPRTFFAGDLDGDGSAEAMIDPYGSYQQADCGDVTVSLPVRGVVDPFTSHRAIDRFYDTTYEILGDWNGDGLPELWDARASVVLVSPVTITSGGIVGSDTVTLHPDLLDVTSPVFDLGSDGRPEAIGFLTDQRAVVLPTDLEELTNPTATTSWDISGGYGVYTYVDRGHAWLVIVGYPTYRRVDLGPATAL